MLKRWLQQLGDAMSPAKDSGSKVDREHALRVANAALMVEVARADHSFDEAELALMLELMAQRFDLTPEECAALASTAEVAAEDAVSVYEFTQQLHEHLRGEEKSALISQLWQVAYADGRLDKYENSLVLKISDLMFVPRGQVMRLKHDAALAAGATPSEQRRY